MKAVLRVSNGSKDYRHVLGSGVVTVYNRGGGSDKFSVKDTEALGEFVALALAKGKSPYPAIAHSTNKNQFLWGPLGVERHNKSTGKAYPLSSWTEHTLTVAKAMVASYGK